MELLIEQIAEIERQLSDGTMSHSDQQLLVQMWDELNEQLEALEDDERTITLSDTESIHTLPKRPGSLHTGVLIDIGNGCYITLDESEDDSAGTDEYDSD